MQFKDYYEVFGLERDATQDEIKRAYRKLARKYHPDVSKLEDAEERFKELGEAYEVLKDPEKRKSYDQLGANWQAGQDFRPPPNWDKDFEFHGGGFTDADAGEFSDFFESLFGREGFRKAAGSQGARDFHARGQDSYVEIEIDLEDSYQGTTRSLTLTHSEVAADGRPQQKERTLKVRIPKGVIQGQHIRLGKQGAAGYGQGPAGDLFLQVRFRQHPFYHVEGKDVYVDVPVAPWEAALGAKINVPTPSGVVDLKIPANSPGGKKLRLKGRGIPAKTAGDLYVVLRIALPPADTDVSRQAYQDFEKKCKFNPRSELGV